MQNPRSSALLWAVTVIVGLVVALPTTVLPVPAQAAPTPAATAAAATPRAAAAHSHASRRWKRHTHRQYAKRVKGRSAYEYVAWRAQHRKPGERLAIVSGVDHVAVYDGRVESTYRLLKQAKSLGYQIDFVTGSGLPRARRLLREAGYDGLYDDLSHCDRARRVSSRCKASYRAGVVRRGYRLVINIGAHRQAWRYGPQGERTIRLRY